MHSQLIATVTRMIHWVTWTLPAIPVSAHNNIIVAQDIRLKTLDNLCTKTPLCKGLIFSDSQCRRSHVAPSCVVTLLPGLMKSVEDWEV